MTLAVRPLHLLLFLFVMLIWGLNFAVAKLGLAQLPAILLMTLRFGLFALLAAPFVKWPGKAWPAVFMVSVTLGFLHFALMFTGLSGIDAATAAIAIQLQVPFAALLAAIVFNDKIGWRRAIGLAIAFLGVALIAGEPRFRGNYLSLGLVIAAALVWAVANIQIKKLGAIDGFTLNAWVSILATPQLLVASLVLEQGHLAALQAADWRAVFSIVYQAVLVLGVGYGIWYWLLRQYEVNQAMPFTLLVPLVGVASGVFLLGEPLTPYLIVGGLLTVIGVAIILIRRPRTAAPEAERI